MALWITVIGLIAAFFTSIALLPQAIKTFRTKKAVDVSLGMYVIMTAGLSLWLLYGVLLNDIPLIVANVTAIVLALVVLALKLKYG